MKSKRIRLLMASVFVAWLAGCASPASKEALVVDDASFGTKHPYSVSISTSGGGETSATGYTNVSNEDLAAAIEESIVATGLFSSVIKGNGADYKLDVLLVSMSKPMFSFYFTIDMEMAWVLVNVRTGDAVMIESIRSSYTETSGAFLAETKIRIAVEGATQNNIRQGLNKIAALSLS